MKPICILALPSSRSDWFAECFAAASGLKYFNKEFFNPVCNYNNAIEGFGCEMVSNYKQIAKPEPSPLAFELWVRSGFQLNKEVFSAFNVRWFVERFQCIGLVRGESMFPPKRARVLAWYDAIWNSLRDAGVSVSESTAIGRAREARGIAAARLYTDCVTYQIPCLDADKLQNAEYVKKALAEFAFCDLLADALAKSYIAEGVAKC